MEEEVVIVGDLGYVVKIKWTGAAVDKHVVTYSKDLKKAIVFSSRENAMEAKNLVLRKDGVEKVSSWKIKSKEELV